MVTNGSILSSLLVDSNCFWIYWNTLCLYRHLTSIHSHLRNSSAPTLSFCCVYILIQRCDALTHPEDPLIPTKIAKVSGYMTWKGSWWNLHQLSVDFPFSACLLMLIPSRAAYRGDFQVVHDGESGCHSVCLVCIYLVPNASNLKCLLHKGNNDLHYNGSMTPILYNC